MALIPQTPPTGYTEGNCTEFAPVSELFTINLGCIPTRSNNQHIQLTWLNRYGHWDYFRFTANRFDGIGIERETFQSWNTDWAAEVPNKVQYSRGLNDSNVLMTETILVHTGFVNQPTFEWLEELWTSNLVYEIQYNGLWPVNIISTEFEKKIQGNRTVYDLQLEYVYANNIKLLGM